MRGSSEAVVSALEVASILCVDQVTSLAFLDLTHMPELQEKGEKWWVG